MASDGDVRGRYDVVVIGGGAIGLACAYYIGRTGRSVAVFERGRIGRGSSFGNAGQLSPSDCVPLASPGVVSQGLKWLLRRQAPLRLGRRITLEDIAWLARFAWCAHAAPLAPRIAALRDLGYLSLGLIQAFDAEERAAFDYRQEGLLNVYSSAAGWKSGQADAELLRQHGIEGRVLSTETVREYEPLLPPTVCGGVFFPTDAHCEPYRFVTFLASKVAAVGGEIHEHVPVFGLQREANRVTTLHTQRGPIRCDQVVIAAGAQTRSLAQLLGCAIPIVSGWGYSADFAAATPPRVPMLLYEQRVAVTPENGFTRAAGQMELGHTTSSARMRGTSAVIDATRRSFRGAASWVVKSSWGGARPCSADGVPVIGPIPEWSNVTVASGHTMLGITLSVGTGKVVSEMIDRTRLSIPVKGFRVERFRGRLLR